VATPRHSKKTHRQKHQAPVDQRRSPTLPTSGRPVFAQPTPTPDPQGFVNKTSDVIAGCGGYSINKLQSGAKGAIRTPVRASAALTFENYDATDYGYLRIIVTAETLRIEFHPASDGPGAKTPDDVVTVDLKSRTIS